MRNNIILVLLSLYVATPTLGSATTVDKIIIFATDVSGSVSNERYKIQTQGLADGLESKQVKNSIMTGELGKIAMVYVEWAGPTQQLVRVQWSLVDIKSLDADISKFTTDLLEITKYRFVFTQRRYRAIDDDKLDSDATSLGGLLTFIQTQLLPKAPFSANEVVIDISGDGPNNAGPEPDEARDFLVQNHAATINGIVMTDINPDTRGHYENHVKGGPRSFVIPVSDSKQYSEAMRQKLTIELASSRWPIQTLFPTWFF